MVYGFKIVEEMISGLSNWMDEKGYTSTDQFVGAAVPRVAGARAISETMLRAIGFTAAPQ